MAILQNKRFVRLGFVAFLSGILVFLGAMNQGVFANEVIPHASCGDEILGHPVSVVGKNGNVAVTVTAKVYQITVSNPNGPGCVPKGEAFAETTEDSGSTPTSGTIYAVLTGSTTNDSQCPNQYQ